MPFRRRSLGRVRVVPIGMFMLMGVIIMAVIVLMMRMVVLMRVMLMTVMVMMPRIAGIVLVAVA